MGRKIKQNKITSPEKTALINKDNLRLMEDFLSYMKSIKRLGIFDKKDDAIRARLTAEKDIYREFAPQRHLFLQYGIA